MLAENTHRNRREIALWPSKAALSRYGSFLPDIAATDLWIHERCPKTAVFEGEVPLLFVQATPRIERPSEHVKMFGRTWPVPCRGTSIPMALSL